MYGALKNSSHYNMINVHVITGNISRDTDVLFLFWCDSNTLPLLHLLLPLSYVTIAQVHVSIPLMTHTE